MKPPFTIESVQDLEKQGFSYSLIRSAVEVVDHLRGKESLTENQGLAVFAVEADGSVDAVAYSIPVPSTIAAAYALLIAWDDTSVGKMATRESVILHATRFPGATFAEYTGRYLVGDFHRQFGSLGSLVSFAGSARAIGDVPLLIGLISSSKKVCWILTSTPKARHAVFH